jgi:hypothetical protein
MTPCFRRQPALSHPVSRGPSSRVGGEFPPPISGTGPLVEERKRIEEELEAVAKGGSYSGRLRGRLRARQRSRCAARGEKKLGAFYEHKEAPQVQEALLKVAGAA